MTESVVPLGYKKFIFTNILNTIINIPNNLFFWVHMYAYKHSSPTLWLKLTNILYEVTHFQCLFFTAHFENFISRSFCNSFRLDLFSMFIILSFLLKLVFPAVLLLSKTNKTDNLKHE